MMHRRAVDREAEVEYLRGIMDDAAVMRLAFGAWAVALWKWWREKL